MFRTNIVLGIIIISFLFFSCTSSADEEKTLLADLQIELERPDSEAGLNGLISLDQNHNSPLTKLFLSIVYSRLGDSDRSIVYFNQINTTQMDKYSIDARKLFYLQGIEIALFSQDYQKVLKLFQEIKSIGGQLTPNQKILEALAYERSGDFDSSLVIYNEIWEQNREVFTLESLQSFLNSLLQNNNNRQILDVIDGAELSLGFYPGMGMAESGSFERLQLIRESLIAAYKEIDYAFYYDGINQIQIHENLNRVSLSILQSLTQGEREQINLLISGLKAYASEDYLRASQIFTGQLTNSDYSFSQYLLLSAQIHTSQTIVLTSDIAKLVSFESRYKSHPGYYLTLWKSMKSGSGDYRFSVVKEILEKSILLYPQGPAALEARKELVRLLNISIPPNNFYLPQEIIPLIQQEIETGEDRFLEPLITMLSSGSHFYSDSLIIALENVQRESGYNISRVLRRYQDRFPDVVLTRLMQSGLL